MIRTDQTRDTGVSSVLLWGLVGVLIAPQGKRLQTGVGFAVASPLLDRLEIALERQRQVKLEQERVASAQAALQSLSESISLIFSSPAPQSTKALSSPAPGIIETGEWLKLIKHPSVVLVLGKRGGGKSALGYRLLEYLRWAAKAYVIGLPKEARALLPEWIGMETSLENIPLKAAVLVDEGYLAFHARRSMSATSVEMSQLVNLSRQREQTLIFVSQEARSLDRNIASSADVIIFKDLGILQLKFDRRELNDLAIQARERFATIKGDRRPWSFVYAPEADFVGLVQNTLPTFWHEKLSHIFATGGAAIARAPKKTPLSQRIEKAKELSRQGLSQGEIARLIGVSRPTVKNYLEDYPYKG